MRILVLSTFSAENPQHGGQHRLANILVQLRKAGHEPYLRGVLGSGTYPETDGFVTYPAEELSRVTHDASIMGDWGIGHIFSEQPTYFDKLCDKIDIMPDAILCELPWLFRFAIRFRERILKNAKIPIIYGSENIEYILKGEIVGTYYDQDYTEKCIDDVRDTELEAIGTADLVLAVSEHDRSWLRDNTNAKVILAPNGVADRRASLEDVLKSSQVNKGHKFALYCASAHRPNGEGFLAQFREGLSAFAPDERLVLAGAVGMSLTGDSRFYQIPARTSRLIDAGLVEESVLRGLLATAHAIVLPLTHGGGTNLKTAEAIWSGQHVVATTKAMRGFEEFIEAPGIHVADEPAEFVRAVHHVMGLPQHHIDADERVRRRVVLWDHTLASLGDALANFN